jgi:hypothetical protein
MKKLLKKELELELEIWQIATLFKFLDWLVHLPPEREEQLINEVELEIGGKSMAYITSWERIAKKKGKIEGKLEGKLEDKREVLVRLLSQKFALGQEEQEKIAREDNANKLNKALDQILFASTKEEVLKVLD